MSKMETFKEPLIYGVYIMEFEDSYKVGISSNVDVRAKTLKGKTLDFTEVGDCSHAWLFEHLIHKRLAQHCVRNEYFNCDYQTVIRAYNDCLFGELTCVPYNHTTFVDVLPKASVPTLDDSLESIIKRGKYLATM